MKIAIIVRRLDVKGGAQRQALSLAKELNRQGHSITLYTFSLDSTRCYPELLQGLAIRTLNPELSLSSWERRWSWLHENHLAKRLAFLIDRQTELLNPHDTVAYRVAYYYKRHISLVPSVWQMNDLPSARWVMDRAKAFKPDLNFSLKQRLSAGFSDLMDRFFFLRVQDGIAVLDRFNQELLQKYFGQKSVVIRSGLDIKHFTYRERSGPRRGPILLLAAGIFFPHRRFEDAILAVERLVRRGYEVRLAIVGNPKVSPDYNQKLSLLVKQKRLEQRIIFRGEIPEEELVAAYQACGAFIFSNDLQTWGLAVFEAMACGAPVIVSRGAGAHEVLTHRENALLVNPRRPDEIAAAAAELIDNPALYEKLSRQGSEFVRKNITWGGYAEAMMALFQSALAKTRK